MIETKKYFTLMTVVLLFLSLANSGCSIFNSNSQERPEISQAIKNRFQKLNYFGIEHNQIVSQTYKKLIEEKHNNTSFKLNKATLRSAMNGTNTIRSLNLPVKPQILHPIQSVLLLRKMIDNKIKKSPISFVTKSNTQPRTSIKFTRKQSTNKIKRITYKEFYKELYEAHSITKPLLRSMDKIIIQKDPNKVRLIAERAAQKMTKGRGNFLLIFASFYMNSLEYWKKNLIKWEDLRQDDHSLSALASRSNNHSLAPIKLAGAALAPRAHGGEEGGGGETPKNNPYTLDGFINDVIQVAGADASTGVSTFFSSNKRMFEEDPEELLDEELGSDGMFVMIQEGAMSGKALYTGAIASASTAAFDQVEDGFKAAYNWLKSKF